MTARSLVGDCFANRADSLALQINLADTNSVIPVSHHGNQTQVLVELHLIVHSVNPVAIVKFN